jgi:hypothetical protein
VPYIHHARPQNRAPSASRRRPGRCADRGAGSGRAGPGVVTSRRSFARVGSVCGERNPSYLERSAGGESRPGRERTPGRHTLGPSPLCRAISAVSPSVPSRSLRKADVIDALRLVGASLTKVEVLAQIIQREAEDWRIGRGVRLSEESLFDRDDSGGAKPRYPGNRPITSFHGSPARPASCGLGRNE